MPKHLLPSKPLKPPSGYELMKDFLAKFKRKPCVLGDGNCLFRALSVQLTGTDENHIALRKISVEFEEKILAFLSKRYKQQREISLLI